MKFKRLLPIPKEIREEMPLSAETAAKKPAFDAQVADILTGKDDRKLVIIGPCSADREDSVLEYAAPGEACRARERAPLHRTARLH